MWRDICLSNREALSHELKRYRTSLDTLQKYIDESDGKALESVFENAVKTVAAWSSPENKDKNDGRNFKT